MHVFDQQEATILLVAGLVNETEVGPSLEKSKTGSLEMIPENCPLDPNGRLSISLDDQVRCHVRIPAHYVCLI